MNLYYGKSTTNTYKKQNILTRTNIYWVSDGLEVVKVPKVNKTIEMKIKVLLYMEKNGCEYYKGDLKVFSLYYPKYNYFVLLSFV